MDATATQKSCHYVVTAQKPTNVTHSQSGNFTGTDDLNLIVAKSTRLEVHVVTPEGLQPVFETPIYGRISCMKLFRPPGHAKDLLFLVTERYKFCILQYMPETRTLQTNAQGDVRDAVGRASELGHLAVVDPEARMVGLQLYAGVLKVIPLADGNAAGDAFNVALKETVVLDIACLPGFPKPTIAVLYQDTFERRHLKTVTLDVGGRTLATGPFSTEVERGATNIIPMPLPLGGVIVAGSESVTYTNGHETKTTAVDPMYVKTYELIDTDGSRILLGDHNGGLHCLVVTKSADGKAVEELTLQRIGVTSIAASLRYLDNGVVFVGSCFGDSQLIKLHDELVEGTDSYVEVMESYVNLGPILDFCVMDMERQGQGQIVTCSGAYKDGSLRIVSNGIGIDEQAVIELPGIKGIWSLRAAFDATSDKYLVQTYTGETRVFGIEGEEMEETDIAGFDAGSLTLHCGNVLGDALVQVTHSDVCLVSCSDLSLLHSWKPEGDAGITVATGNPSQVLLALTGGKLVYLEVDTSGDAPALKQVAEADMPHEVSCLSMEPLHAPPADGDLDLEATAPTRSHWAAVGLWTDVTVRMLQLPSLTQTTEESLGGDIQARSVLLSTLEGSHFLFVGLGDGHLISYRLDAATGVLASRKKVSLGTQPIQLSAFQSKGVQNVFAACDRPTVLYSSSGKLLFSNVNLSEATFMAPFSSEAFPDCLALSSETDLTIGTIDDIQKLRISTVPLGEQPLLVVHHKPTKSLAVCTTVATAETGAGAGASDDPPSRALEKERGFVRLVDDTTFEIVASFELGEYEVPMGMVSTTFADDDTEYLVVGTSVVKDGTQESESGRLVVLTVLAEEGGDEAAVTMRRLVEVAATPVTFGGVTTVCSFKGKLLAGVNSTVQLYGWESPKPGEGAGAGDPTKRSLVAECGHRAEIMVLTLRTRGDFITVGDLMTSILLLRYTPEESKMELLANDSNSHWITDVSMVSDNVYLASEHSCNLFVAARRSGAATEEERTRLDVVGQFHLGEMVNCLRQGSLVMQPAEVAEAAPAAGAGASAAAPAADGGDAPAAAAASVAGSVAPTKILYASVNGAIGVIATLKEPLFAYLKRAQAAIAGVVRGVGGFTHREWRSWHHERQVPAMVAGVDDEANTASGFVDGDLVELFLELPPESQAAVVAAMNSDGAGSATAGPTGAHKGAVTVESLVDVVETLGSALK